jgi:hypothetical protein
VPTDVETSFMLSNSQQLIATNLILFYFILFYFILFYFISVANLMAKHPPFNQYPLADMLAILQPQ